MFRSTSSATRRLVTTACTLRLPPHGHARFSSATGAGEPLSDGHGTAEAIEHPPDGVRMLTVPEIRRAGRVIQQDEG